MIKPKKQLSIEIVKDKSSVLAIARSLPHFFSNEGLASMTKDLKTHILRGAFMDNTLVGFVILRKADMRSLEISWLAILPSYQNQGIGKKLVKESLKYFTDKKYIVCYVKTLAETANDDGYAKTRAFYKSLGFQALEIINPYPGWSDENPCQILATALPLSQK